MQTCDDIVFIGQFQPFHNGDQDVVRHALKVGDRLIVVIGSSDAPRSARAPWTADERETMIRAAAGPDAGRILFRHVVDHPYDPAAWQAEVRRQVDDAIRSDGRDPATATIGLIATANSHAFPEWQTITAPATATPSANELRDQLFSRDMAGLQARLPPAVFATVTAFTATDTFAALAEEYQHILAYKKAWAAAPYPPIFTTVDAVVVHSGHVLLVRRGGQPGRGLWALPGGFVEQDETLLDAVVRELGEETRISLPAPLLKAGLRGSHVFDAPDRSQRGRTITYAFHFAIGGTLPEIQAADDAELARWTPLAELSDMRAQLFEDHFYILEHFLGA